MKFTAKGKLINVHLAIRRIPKSKRLKIRCDIGETTASRASFDHDDVTCASCSKPGPGLGSDVLTALQNLGHHV